MPITNGHGPKQAISSTPESPQKSKSAPVTPSRSR
jgi:hypothetical protein